MAPGLGARAARRRSYSSSSPCLNRPISGQRKRHFSDFIRDLNAADWRSSQTLDTTRRSIALRKNKIAKAASIMRHVSRVLSTN
jgi:hypothetical protein